jgi:hypothetical protein
MGGKIERNKQNKTKKKNSNVGWVKEEPKKKNSNGKGNLMTEE